jgi:hypothetical protein
MNKELVKGVLNILAEKQGWEWPKKKKQPLIVKQPKLGKIKRVKK